MNQIESIQGLVGELEYGIAQVFPDFPDFSGMVVDDFVAGGTITRVSAAFELGNPSFFEHLPSRVNGWRVSVFASVSQAEQSGNEFMANVLGTQVVTDVTYADLGEVNGVRAFTVDMPYLSIEAGAGAMWLGVSAVMPLTGNDQVFLLGNATPTSRGGGGVQDAVFVNPGQVFGSWRSHPLNIDAAYRVESVPEPTILLAIVIGLASFRIRKTGREIR
jgi:hypothetical protein